MVTNLRSAWRPRKVYRSIRSPGPSGDDERLASSPPEEAAFGPGVRVPVVGNIAHVIVHVVLADLRERHVMQAGAHVLAMLSGRLRAVPAPDHHGHVADVALRDPADVVLVVPGRHALGAAEITPVDLVEAVCRVRHTSPQALASTTT